MTYAAPLARANPSKPNLDTNALTECIQACFDCTQACTADADADLGEPQLQSMVRCIRLCLDCADMCQATGRIISRETAFDATVARAALQACAQICKVSGDECEEHARHGMAHCKTCSEACRRCEKACNALLAALQM
jgi:Domain of Unknown Function (DUF326)